MESPVRIPARLRSHRSMRLLVFAAGPLLLGSCYRRTEWRVPPPPLSEPLIVDYRGETVHLSRAVLEGDSVLSGWRYQVAESVTVVSAEGVRTQVRTADSSFLRLPLRGVERKIRHGPTLLLTAAGALLGVIVVEVLDPCFPFGCGEGEPSG